MKNILLCTALICSAAPVLADEVRVPAAKDNTLFEQAEGTLSNGSGRGVFIGRARDRAEALNRRAVIAFDLEGVVPAGATVTGVTLNMNNSRTLFGEYPIAAHKLTSDWGEGASDAIGQEGRGAPSEAGDATWVHTFFEDQFWTTPGGDFVPAASAETLVGLPGFYEWSSEQMVADVQSWLDDPSSNYGWIMIGDEQTDGSAKRFDSREADFEDNRPFLLIEFTPPLEMARFEPELASARFVGPGEDVYSFVVAFELGDDSDGFDLDNEEVAIEFGPEQWTIPAGAMRCGGGFCTWTEGDREFAIAGDRFAARVRSANLDGLTNPLDLSVRVGNDVGNATVRLGGQLGLDNKIIITPPAERDPSRGRTVPLRGRVSVRGR